MTATPSPQPLTAIVEPESSCRVFFEAEHAAWLRDWLDRIEGEILEELERRVGRRDAAPQLARLFGLPAELGAVVAVAIYSTSREVRLGAGDVILRFLQRTAAVAA